MKNDHIDTDHLSADQVLQLIEQLQQEVTAKAPELVTVTVTDDGETYEALRCPVCGLLVNDGGDLHAVDLSERWNSAEPDMDNSDMDVSQGETDYGSTLYYLHNVGASHAVNLPAGWTESWT